MTARAHLGALPGFTPQHRPWQKVAVRACPSDGVAGNPCSKAPPAPNRRSWQSRPDRPSQLWKVPALEEASGSHSSNVALQPETYCVRGCEDFSRQAALSHPLIPHYLQLPRCPSHSGPCRQCPESCFSRKRSCTWTELALCSACQVAMGSGSPRSQAQLRSRGPADDVTFSVPWAPSGPSQGSRADSSWKAAGSPLGNSHRSR